MTDEMDEMNLDVKSLSNLEFKHAIGGAVGEYNALSSTIRSLYVTRFHSKAFNSHQLIWIQPITPKQQIVPIKSKRRKTPLIKSLIHIPSGSRTADGFADLNNFIADNSRRGKDATATMVMN